MSKISWKICPLLLVVLCGALFNNAHAQDTCRNRTSWLTLTPEERANFINAVKNLSSSRSCANCSSKWDEIASVHNQYAAQVHGTPLFLFWHRAYLHFLENLINIAIPYYDSATDCKGGDITWCSVWSVADAASTTEGIGGNGNATSCVDYGSLSTNFSVRPGTPSPRCLNRQFANGTLLPIQDVDRLVGISIDAASFRANCEGTYHAGFHVQMGGDMQTMYSPSDPIFYMHHSWIDSKWYGWQQGNETRVSDPTVAFENASSATLEMPGLRYLWTTFLPNSSKALWALTPSQVVAVGANKTLCYYYSISLGNSSSSESPNATNNNFTTTNNNITATNNNNSTGNVTYKPFDEDTDDDLNLLAQNMIWPRTKLQNLPETWITRNNLNATIIQEFYDMYNAWVDRVNVAYHNVHPGTPPPKPTYALPADLPPGVTVTSGLATETPTPTATTGSGSFPEPEVIIVIFPPILEPTNPTNPTAPTNAGSF